MLSTTAGIGLRAILKETNELHGWLIPDYVVDYEARVLASKIDRNPWQPEPSYAERYMTLRTPAEALELANTCWFTRAVFPELKSRHGIQSSYYVQLGMSCYEMVLQHTDTPAVRALSKNFEFLAETTYTAIRNFGDFRMMWD
jgi:hypothetical protein